MKSATRPVALALGLVLSVLGVGACDSQAPTPTPPTPAPAAATATQAQQRDEDEAHWVVYRLAGMRQARVERDLVYKTDGPTSLRMDVYYPPDLKRGEQRPAVLLGHGRGGKDSGPWISWGRLLAASGFVSVVFNYRDPADSGRPADILKDIDDLMAYVRTNAGALSVDRDRLGVMAFSALVKHHVSAVLRGKHDYVRAVVAYYGWLDDDEQDISPLYYLRNEQGAVPPMFVAEAGQDRFAPGINDSIDRFVKEARARNVTLEFMIHPTGHHGFDTLDNDDRSKEIVRKTLDFLKTYLTNQS